MHNAPITSMATKMWGEIIFATTEPIYSPIDKKRS
jgi:hypothetical protein